MVSGGTRSNVVAAEARAEIDVRVARPAETQRIDAEVRAVIERYRRDRRPGDTTVVTHWAAFPRKDEGR